MGSAGPFPWCARDREGMPVPAVRALNLILAGIETGNRPAKDSPAR